MVVAIDGPAGVGKSTVAKHVAVQWNMAYLNTGKYYRAVTFLALREGLLSESCQELSWEVKQKLTVLTSQIKWGFQKNAVIAGELILCDELHTQIVDRWVAQVSAVQEVRNVLNQNFRRWGLEQRIVVEGRDMTSEVFPQAEVRIFLDASPHERARRRFNERPEGQTFEMILEGINRRDAIDRNKEVGALRLTPGCYLIDTSDLTIQNVCEKVDAIVRNQESN